MKKGFTLIELLAVIVILSIISAIAIPIVLKIINDVKMNSLKVSMGNLEKATQTQNQKIDSLAQAIRELAQVKITGGTPHVEMKMPSIYKVAIIAACSIISVASLFFIVLRILEITGVIL